MLSSTRPVFRIRPTSCLGVLVLVLLLMLSQDEVSAHKASAKIFIIDPSRTTEDQSIDPVQRIPSTAIRVIQDFWNNVQGQNENNRSTILILRENDERLDFEQQQQLIRFLQRHEKTPFLLVDSDSASVEPAALLALHIDVPCPRFELHSYTAFACNSAPSSIPWQTISSYTEIEKSQLLPLHSIFASAKTMVKRKQPAEVKKSTTKKPKVEKDSVESEEQDDPEIEVEDNSGAENKRVLTSKRYNKLVKKGNIENAEEHQRHDPDTNKNLKEDSGSEEKEEENEDGSKEDDSGEQETSEEDNASEEELDEDLNTKSSSYKESGSGDDKHQNKSEFDSKKHSKVDEDGKHMKTLADRVYCKYRKSCYETGELPLNLHPTVVPHVKTVTFDHEEKSFDKKLRCKYRHSCYESGKLPEELNVAVKAEADFDTEEKEQEEIDVVAEKLKCKYRPSCYVEQNLNVSVSKHSESSTKLMSAKLSAPKGHKKSVQEVAEKALKKAEELENRGKQRPITKSMIAGKKLDEIEEKLNKKLQCKYRQSCYDTGIVPEIETWFVKNSQVEENKEVKQEQIPFEEMEELEKKLFCKYRKKCYETGEKPEIGEEESYQTVQEIVDTIEDTIGNSPHLRCRYRKSCYETGQLPDLSNQETVSHDQEQEARTEQIAALPTNTDSLRAFCKYRKSCYQEIANAEQGVHKVQEIKRGRKKHSSGRRMTEQKKSVNVTLTKREKEKLERHLKTLHKKQPKKAANNQLKNKKYEKESEKDIELAKKEVKAPRTLKRVTLSSDAEDPEKIREAKRSMKEYDPVESQQINDTEENYKAEEMATKKQRVQIGSKKYKSPPAEEPVIKKQKKLRGKQSQKTQQAKQAAPESSDEDAKERTISDEKDSKKQKYEPVVKVKTLKRTQKAKEPTSKTKQTATHTSEPAEKLKTNSGEELGDKKDRNFCKYRKSCYETGKKPVIEQSASTLFSKLEHYVENEYEDIEEQHAAVNAKVRCKYRKSCYETGKLPITNKSSPTVLSKLEHFMEQEYEDIEVQHAAVDAKVHCKYRKSCYETGKLPVISKGSSTVLSKLERFVEQEYEDIEEQHSAINAKLQCKYRKSCYEAKSGQPLPPLTEPTHAAKPSSDELEENVKAKEEMRTKQKVKLSVTKLSSESEEDSDLEEVEGHLQEEETKQTAADVEGLAAKLSVKDKKECKYRSSCYEGVQPRAVVEDHAGGMRRNTKKVEITAPPASSHASSKAANQSNSKVSTPARCHKYILSCRESLGLPPKEKVPIGPNGRKLCRKNKVE